MDGLECSEIKFSKVSGTTTLRFDSDYYKKEYLKIEQFIFTNKDKFVTINDKNLHVDASAFYPSLEPYYNTGTIPFVRVADVKGRIDYDSCVRIPEMDERFSTLYLCSPGDVVLTKGGRVGTAGLITKPSYVTRDLIFINSSILSRKDYITLYLFFSTNFAYKQMIRSSSMTAQPHLTITLIRDLLIYNYSEGFKQTIEEYYTKMERLNNQSQNCYVQATHILEDALDIHTSTFPRSSITTKQISEACGRWDAEYYQPKYEEIEKQIQGNNTVSNSCKLYDNNYIPLDGKFHQYIELANVGKTGGISDVEHVAGCDLPSRARRLVNAGQVIVSSIEGSLASCALITPEYDNAICSTGFYVVSSNKYNSETLLLLFKSDAVQAMLKKRCSGTILTAITKDEFEKMPLPEVDELAQKEIARKLQESFRLREESKRLLNLAVKTVEMAIESDEKSALEWLRNKVEL